MLKKFTLLLSFILVQLLVLDVSLADSITTSAVDTTLSVDDDTLYNSSSSFTNKSVQLKEKAETGIIEYFKNGFNNEDKFVRFSHRLIVILFFIFIATFCFIIINRFIVEYFKRKKLKINDTIEELVAIYLSTEKNEIEEQNKIILELQKLKKNKTAKRILLKNILSVDLAFSGESNLQLRKLHEALNYHIDAKKRLNSESWATRSKAIRELAQMRREEFSDEIRKSLNHINPVLRLEAGVALLKLDHETPFSFLDVDRELTTWQQMNLLEYIRNTNTLKVPNFSKWLHSRQDSVVEFVVKLISHYQQFDALPVLKTLLSHKNWAVRLEVVKCMGSFEFEEIADDLIEFYKTESREEVRIQCIKSIARIGSSNALEFLVSVISNQLYDEKITAAIALREIGAQGINQLKSLLSSYNEEVLKVTRHALDENLILSR